MAMLEDDAVVGELLTVFDESMRGASGSSTYFVDNRADSGLLGALESLSAGDASAIVAGSSIAGHIHHLVFAMDASSDWIEGDRRARDWSDSWRVATVDDVKWQALLGRLHDGYRRLRGTIESGALSRPDAFGEAVGATAHTAYHLGSVWQKVAILREAGRRGST